jgi:hypothetical protein
MSEQVKAGGTESNIESTDAGQKTRRAFVKTAAQVAVTAPAVGILLSASTKPAAAQISPYQASSQHILDDFTTGNNEEDIDSKTFGNFNPINGTVNQDDTVPL